MIHPLPGPLDVPLTGSPDMPLRPLGGGLERDVELGCRDDLEDAECSSSPADQCSMEVRPGTLERRILAVKRFKSARPRGSARVVVGHGPVRRYELEHRMCGRFRNEGFDR